MMAAKNVRESTPWWRQVWRRLRHLWDIIVRGERWLTGRVKYCAVCGQEMRGVVRWIKEVRRTVLTYRCEWCDLSPAWRDADPRYDVAPPTPPRRDDSDDPRGQGGDDK